MKLNSKKLIAGFAASLALSVTIGVAQADGDTPTVPVWDGIYVGVHGGYGWAKGTGTRNCYIDDVSGQGGDIAGNLCDAPWWVFEDGRINDGDSNNDWSFVDYFDLDGDFVAAIDQVINGKTISGWNYGGQIGVNHQMGSAVLGLEADFSLASMGKSNQSFEFEYFHDDYWWSGEDYLQYYDGNFEVMSSSSLDWLATFRGRMGIAMGSEGRILPYVTGGAALARVSTRMSTNEDTAGGVNWCDGACEFGSVSGDGTLYQPGAVVGAGMEWMISDNVSIGAEYLYTKLYGQGEASVVFHADDGRSFAVKQAVGLDNVQTVNFKLNFLMN